MITTINDELSDIKPGKDDNNLDKMPEAKLLDFQHLRKDSRETNTL